VSTRAFIALAAGTVVAATAPAVLLTRNAPAPRGCVGVLEAGFMGAQTRLVCDNRRTPAALVRQAR
jgi:hypothetical protein